MKWDIGRFDGEEEEDLRFWQIVKDFEALDKTTKNLKICFVGFPSDKGVKKNLGRIGAAEAPNVIRAKMASLPKIGNVELYDAGDCLASDHTHESNQKVYGEKVTQILENGALPIGLGGGHGIAYGTFNGVKNAIDENKKIGIINFDAHLDMRPYDQGTSSGTMFKQIADENSEFHYMPIGIQTMGNTQRLFNIANKHGVSMITLHETIFDKLETLEKKIIAFSDKVDVIYLTFCMDVFDVSDAPGVSAPSAVGLDKRLVLKLLNTIFSSKKVIAVDFAEVNPSLDIDDRTAKLVAYLTHYMINIINKKEL